MLCNTSISFTQHALKSRFAWAVLVGQTTRGREPRPVWSQAETDKATSTRACVDGRWAPTRPSVRCLGKPSL